METACRYCCFAVWEGKTQIDCQIGMLQKFRNAGITVEEVMSPPNLEDKEFYLVHGPCISLRSEKWKNGCKDPIKQVELERKLRLDLIILLDPSKPDYLEKTLQSVQQQTTPINRLIISSIGAITKPGRISQLCREFVDNIPWRIKTNLINNQETAIDLAFNEVIGNFYSVWQSGIKIPKTFVEDISNFLNNQFIPFCVLLPYKENGLTILSQLHQQLDGNIKIQMECGEVEGLLNKVQLLESPTKMIYRVEEVCNALLL